jgi:hypothetical protein
MDKSWISNNSVTIEDYIRGILSFLNFAFANSIDMVMLSQQRERANNQ